MSFAKQFSFVLGTFALVWATGCCGPLRCGPQSCGTSGPLAMHNCDGCGDCDGCGELYIDPWINHPADRCDPCDRCGNYNGQSCGKCRSVFGGLRSLWGYRCDGNCSGGCDSCGGGSGCDSCGVSSCSGGCGGCDSCGLSECGCGVEASCGCEGSCSCEPACGIEAFGEPACGCEGGCSSCGGGHTYITQAPPIGHQHVTQTHATEVYRPSRERQIFKSRH